jgi:thioredoxin-dependent peroxiredoxin
MIEPSKATKGRRMSKKTRKKTLKKPARTVVAKAARARSATSTKKPAAKKRAKPADNSAGRSPPKSTPASGRRPAKAATKGTLKSTAKSASKTATKTTASKVSHGGPSKPLKSPAPAEVSRSAAPESKPVVAAKPVAAKAAAQPAAGHAVLAEGSSAPAFRLPRDGGETVSLADFAGRKLVLFFYPRANTPGCTKEAIDFTRLARAFAESQTMVLGVSADPLTAQESFRDKHELGIPLVSDEQHGMLEAYGAWGEKSMYGKTFLGILRTTVLIGADGRIVKIWRHVKVDGHADEVLAAAQAA